MRHSMWIAASLTALGLTSCGGPSTSGNLFTDASVSAADACSDIITAYCKRITACAPALMSLVWGDEATCIDRSKPSCAKGLAAPSTGATPARYQACATDERSSECSALLSRNTPVSCRPTGGGVAAGSTCGDDWQCQSGFCSVPAGQNCGACATRKAAGSSCTDDAECDFGMSCAGAVTKVCIAQGAAGSSCDDNHPCASPNVCIGRTATASGTCGPGAPPGGDCRTSGCDLVQGLFCHPTTQVCQKIGFAKPGEACGFVNNGLTLCTGSICTPPGQLVGTCAAVADDGAACDDTNGPRCKPNARCVGGTCQVVDPSVCK